MAEGTVVTQGRPEEGPDTSGSAVHEGEGHQSEEPTPADVEGEEALADHPFWGLLLRAGYTYGDWAVTGDWAILRVVNRVTG